MEEVANPLAEAFMAFNTLPLTAKVWVYQANRALEIQDVNEIKSILAHFASTWETHGSSLKAEADMLFNRFIIMAVDEENTGASGCSIDKSVQLIKRLETDFNVNFFDRLQICYLKENDILDFKFPELQAKVNSGEISKDTLIFNNTVTTLGEVNRDWILPMDQSWLAKHL